MPHTPEEKKRAVTRLRRIRGQSDALIAAVERGEECGALLQQLAAVRGAINGLMLQVMEGHVREHLGDANASEAQREKDLEMVVSVLRSYVK